MSKITSLLFLLISCISYSQTEKLIHGKVSYQDSYQKNVDVINFITKKITNTNVYGEFDITAKVGDALILMSENFADQKYILTKEDFAKGSVLIKLIEKPIALDEVEIKLVKDLKLATVSYNDLKMTKIEKEQARPKNTDVYTGEMVNGMDFVQIGKMIGKLFKSKKPKTSTTEVTFSEYSKANFNQSFYTKTLKLKPSETARFIDYCEADSKSKIAMKSNDELTILEFLMEKKTEFDKLK
ncbi:hypothetical protein [Flavobacterium sp.]|uniref:hypothetical protein n=1 Tax=Flavobacterium sp. TaxID=239 RepID=UPI0024897EAA|nr:hypothetical protein [Flavobacterium sp.]MDI1316283.1 hypothetical protein [Flavobacterium sp.]